MSKCEQKPGCKTLEKNEEQVVLTIRNNLEKITKFLRDKEIVPQALYLQVTDPMTRETDDQRARLVYRRLMSMIEEDDEIYLVFMYYIRNNTNSDKTIRMLDQTYSNHKEETVTNTPGMISLIGTVIELLNQLVRLW